MASLKDAGTGVSNDILDVGTPYTKPGDLPSGATIYDPTSYVWYQWPVFVLGAGVKLLEIGLPVPSGSGESWGSLS